ncbi:MAG: hypothetical protein JJU19_02180 [Pararhodobacter sp.]|nr:hypothetical protein [Pararhodobacter sp.]
MPARNTPDPAPDYHGYDEGYRLPRLVRLYILQCLIGFALSGLFTALLLWFNVAGLGTLVMATQGGFMALFLLFFFNGLVFAGVQFAITIMRMAGDDGNGGGRRDGALASVPGRILAALAQPARMPAQVPVADSDRSADR